MHHIIFILIVCFSLSGIADQSSTRANIYYQDKYVTTSNNFTFKLNGFWSFPYDEKISDNKIKYGYGANASLSSFIESGAPLPGIAIEIGLGAGSYHWKNQKDEDKDDLYIIPAYGVAKFCLAPYGGINPYIGLGGHATYIYSSQQHNEMGFGTLLQGGIDFIGNDNTIYNFDIKKYFGSNDVTYGKNIAGQSTFTSTINPLIISIGIGFKF